MVLGKRGVAKQARGGALHYVVLLSHWAASMAKAGHYFFSVLHFDRAGYRRRHFVVGPWTHMFSEMFTGVVALARFRGQLGACSNQNHGVT